jgi:hypothetical protein
MKMKTNVIILVFLLSSNFLLSQTTRSGLFTANMPNVYPISGDVTMTSNNGNLVVDFASNFETIQGITLEVFLGKTNVLNSATDVLISTIPLGPGIPFQGSISGAHSYTVPNSVDINDFDYVLVQCTSANILWGFAELATISRNGNFVANMPAVYPISGDASLASENGNLTVHFDDNFVTIQGITLEVFLAKENILNTATDVKVSTIPLGPGASFQDPITGAHAFSVPTGVDFYEFNYILIQCTSANILWGYVNICELDLALHQQPLSAEIYLAEEITSTSELSINSDYRFEGYNGLSLDTGFEVPLTTEFVGLTGQPYGCVAN